jgi:lysophospholipase L1-like esterase
MNRMNSVGLRGTREYTPTPLAGILRVAAFGDSFVYGAEVDNAHAWAGLLENGRPAIEVLNYGVGGYGVDQAYLRYLFEGQAFSPHIVLMGFIPDDINRNISVYRRFLSPGAALFKPRYVLDDRGDLALLEVPLKTPADYEKLLANPRDITRLGRTDYWYPPCVYENPLHDYSATVRLACAAGGQVYRRYVDPDRPVKGAFFNENSSAFKIQVALFRAFAATVRERRALPLILMLPDFKAVERRRRGEPPIYEPLMRALRNLDLPYVDAADAFFTEERVPETKTLFTPGGHYSSSGNQLVAAWLGSKLRQASTQLPHGGGDQPEHSGETATKVSR